MAVTSGGKSGVVKQVYYDPVLGERVGYNYQGRVYEDEEMTRRIPVGSVVPTQNGTFVLTEKGGVRLDQAAGSLAQAMPIGSGAAGGLAAGGILSQYEQAARKASLLAADAEIQTLNAQRPEIQREYDQLARKAYQAYRLGQGALANRLASAGLYHSGYADTLQTAYESAYQEQVGENERARNKALAALEQQAIKLKTAQTAAEQQLAAEMAKLRLSQYNTEPNLALKAEESRLAEEWRQKQFAANRDDEMWNREYLLQKEAARQADAAPSAGPSGSKAKAASGGDDSKPSGKASLSAIQKAELERDAHSLANTYFKNGDRFQEFLTYLGSQSVRKMYESKYGAAGYDYLIEKAIAAYEEKKAGKSGDEISLSAAQVQALANSLLEQLAAGMLTAERLREYLNTAGFDKNTKALLELYLSGVRR